MKRSKVNGRKKMTSTFSFRVLAARLSEVLHVPPATNHCRTTNPGKQTSKGNHNDLLGLSWILELETRFAEV